MFKLIKLIYSLIILTISMMIIGSCTNETVPLGISDTTAKLENIAPNTLAGEYLAGRFAQHEQDWKSAQKYIQSAYERDNDNNLLAERAFLLSLGSGDIAKARELSRNFKAKNSNLDELSLIFMTCDEISQNNYQAALDIIQKMPDSGFGQYTKPLLKTWAMVGLNQVDEAEKYLTSNSFNADPIFHIHAGLIAEYKGDNAVAEKHYKVAMENGLELHTAIIVANFFERTDKPEIAQSIYENLDNMYPYKPFTRALNNKDRNLNNIDSPKTGAALAMFDLTSILYNNRAYDSAKIYGSMVQMLDNNSDLTKIIIGDIEAVHNLYSEALNLYSSIGKNSEVYWLAKTRISEVYELTGQLDKSIDILKAMAKDVTIKTQVMASLGDLYRRNNRFDDAIKAYDEALASAGDVKNEHWAIIYARGIAKEQSNTWDSAEKDLLTALRMQPHNPMVLNYIAYSWAEKGIKLDKALIFAEQAVKLKPYDGSIMDSYGWILFRLGRYSEAKDNLEQAVELIPNDTVILDHLGDAYWKCGNQNEARNQWRKSANLSTDTKFTNTVLNKVKYGIITADEMQSQNAQLAK